MSDIIRSTCSYCSVGCAIDVTRKPDGSFAVKGAKDYPVNLGNVCPKGFHLVKALEAADRGTVPLVRNAAGELVQAGWDEAETEVVRRFKALKEQYGPESVAVISTGQLPTEEMAYLGALFKFGMGFLHMDGNTRQCMATAVVAYKQSFGFDAPPFSYKDAEESDLLIFVGANPVIAHPLLWNRVRMNQKNPAIVVVDPRHTETAAEAALHLPVAPKGDLAFWYAVTKVVLAEGWESRPYWESHTEGWAEYEAFLAGLALDDLVSASGLSLDAVTDLARRIHEAPAVSWWWTMGVNQSHEGTRTAQAMINLALMTGNIGRPGTGPNSITGQANAMGSRILSNTTALFAGRDFADAGHRAEVAAILGIPVEVIPDKPSLPYHKILEAVRTGTIKGLWVVCTNPAHSWIQQGLLDATLGQLDTLVVQDIYPTTETAARAHVYLPAAGAGEKAGTFINSERRVGLVQKFKDAPGEARSDLAIFQGLARAWGCGALFKDWTDPEAIFRLLQRLSAGRPCDISGIRGYAHLREAGGVQWPFPSQGADEAQERRLYADGRWFTPSGRVKVLFAAPSPKPDTLDADFPTLLLTGRGTIAQWHTQTRTGKVPILQKMYPLEAYVEVHPEDAGRWSLAEGQKVRLVTRQGQAAMNVKITDKLAPGQVFVPMHYPEANQLTKAAFDPYSFQPSYKYAAVRLEAL